MCLFKVKIRGVKILGRQVYRTDSGVCLGYNGPQVTLEAALADLSYPLANSLSDNVAAIDRKIISGEIRDSNGEMYITSGEYLAAAGRDPRIGNLWDRDENPGLYATTPPDVACRQHEDEERDWIPEDTNPNNVPF